MDTETRTRYRGYLHCALAAIALSATAACSSRSLSAEPESLKAAAPELIERLRADPFDYFRFANRPWIARVCDVFGAELNNLPVVRLHGDAHIEQFVVTKDAWGLDDFDDSARGPALIDIERFLGSVDVVTRQRSWEKERDVLFDRFFEGYRRGLAGHDDAPVPEIVHRLRSEVPPTQSAFLAWGESKMRPVADETMTAIKAAVEAFARVLLRERVDLAPGYLRVVRAGWFQTGVGSSRSPTILVRVQGPTDDPADDELLELKKIGELSLGCLEVPRSQPAIRIIDGSRQLGRIRHKIMAAGPELVIPEVEVRGQQLRDWWIHSLEPSYRAVSIADLRSVDDLAVVVYDSGIQLGAGHAGKQNSAERQQSVAVSARLEKRYRQEATTLVDYILRGWSEFRAS